MFKMWAPVFIISLVTLSVDTIKVPVETTEENQTKLIPIDTSELTHNKPIYYIHDEEKVDGYAIPQSPYKLEEIDEADIEPATYLVPPPPGKHTDYYLKPTEPEQTDWYPIASKEPSEIQSDVTVSSPHDNPIKQHEVNLKFRNGKVLERGHVLEPPRNLVPPGINSQNDFIILTPSSELELPLESEDTTLNVKPTYYQKHSVNPLLKTYPAGLRHNKIHLLPYLMPPPKNLPLIYPKPTKLFPKKFVSDYTPIPIPINQYNDDLLDEVPMARPLKPFKPTLSDTEHLPLSEEKNIYLLEKAENKRRLKEEQENSQTPAEIIEPSDPKLPAEQEASESNYRHPGRNVHPGQVKQGQPAAAARPNHAASNGDRTEFRMHGMKGPHSYQFGYDTGKGKNRQFRYEERDNEGNVKGHYGYVDNHGKLRVVNYDADPEHGFRAEAPVEQDA